MMRVSGLALCNPERLMYLRAFAEAWPDTEIVQQLVGRLPWGHNLVLLTSLPSIEQIERELSEGGASIKEEAQ